MAIISQDDSTPLDAVKKEAERTKLLEIADRIKREVIGGDNSNWTVEVRRSTNKHGTDAHHTLVVKFRPTMEIDIPPVEGQQSYAQRFPKMSPDRHDDLDRVKQAQTTRAFSHAEVYGIQDKLAEFMRSSEERMLKTQNQIERLLGLGLDTLNVGKKSQVKDEPTQSGALFTYKGRLVIPATLILDNAIMNPRQYREPKLRTGLATKRPDASEVTRR